MAKKPVITSILANKCPQCHVGEVWESSNPYNFSLFWDMHSHCSNCNLKYEREHGFFYGAMYVSYGVGVAAFVAAWIAMYVLLPNASLNVLVATTLIFIIAVAPWNYHVSRLVWLNIFIGYKEKEAWDK